jgi:hypothetical protein
MKFKKPFSPNTKKMRPSGTRARVAAWRAIQARGELVVGVWMPALMGVEDVLAMMSSFRRIEGFETAPALPVLEQATNGLPADRHGLPDPFKKNLNSPKCRD